MTSHEARLEDRCGDWGSPLTPSHVDLLAPHMAGLRMMGLSPLISALGWWAVYALIFTVGASAITLIASLAELFPGASPLLLWVTMELYVFAMVAACFVVSSVMASAKPSQGVASLFCASP